MEEYGGSGAPLRTCHVDFGACEASSLADSDEDLPPLEAGTPTTTPPSRGRNGDPTSPIPVI